MELRQLRYFVTVAEEQHFGRAAERLHIGQPAVSQQVRRLERELGIELFDRSPRHVRLTAAGESFLPEARAVLAAEVRARAVAAELTQQYTGVLRLGTSKGLGARLGTVLEEITRRAPGVDVELVGEPTRQRLDRVAQGTLDATFVRGAVDSITHRAIPVWQDHLIVALPARHELSAQTDVALADLADLPLRLVPRSRNPVLVDLVVQACHREGLQPVPSPLTDSLEDTLAIIGSGTPMWTVVYAAHAKQLRSPRVAFRPLRGCPLSVATTLCVRVAAPTPFLPLLLAACRTAAHHQDS